MAYDRRLERGTAQGEYGAQGEDDSTAEYRRNGKSLADMMTSNKESSLVFLLPTMFCDEFYLSNICGKGYLLADALNAIQVTSATV